MALTHVPTALAVSNRQVYTTGAPPSLGNAARGRLAWLYDYSGITGTITFRVQVDDGAGGWIDLGTTTNLTLNLTALPINVTRTAQVRAEHSTLGNSSYTQLIFATSDNVPASDDDVPPVVDFHAALVTSTSALCTWQFPTASSSTVEVEVEAIDVGAVPSPGYFYPADCANTLTLTGLTPGKTYHLLAINTGADSAGSATNTYSQGPVIATIVMAAPNDSAPISGPTDLLLETGAPVSGEWYYLGSGDVVGWTVSGLASTGLTVETPTADKRVLRLTGALTLAEGIYQLTVWCQSRIGLARTSSRYPLRLVVGGLGLGSCLAWLHDDYTRVDLQPEYGRGNGAVYSYASSGTDKLAALRFTRGDPQHLYLIPRDRGGNLLTAAVTKVQLIIRLADRRAGLVLYDYSGTGGTETIGAYTVTSLDVTLDSPVIDKIFARLNSAPGPSPSAAQIECSAELTLQLTDGPVRTLLPIPCTLAQDSER